MTWFLLSIFIAALSALINIVDKHILSKYLQAPTQAVGVLVIFSLGFYVLCIPYLGLFTQEGPFIFPLYSVIAGIFEVIYLFLYLKAIEREDVAFVVPLFALSPIFSILPAWFLLNQQVSRNAFLGMIVIFLSLFLLSWSKKGKVISPSKYYFYMIFSALFYAVYSAFLGKGLEQTSFFDNMLFSRLGVVIGGLLLMSFTKTIRLEQFFTMRSYIYILPETLYLFTVWLFILALQSGPVAYVIGIINVQPVFVLLMSIFLWKLYPNFLDEKTRVHFKKPFFALLSVILVVLGSLLIYV
ncbi:MAG TPA: DMT family transporter [Patescibacteria group bacterium]|nr:DMT family transporter [Patescibacteria group bacterium]